MNLSKKVIKLYEDFKLSNELKLIRKAISNKNLTLEQLLVYKSNLELWSLKSSDNTPRVDSTLKRIAQLIQKAQ